MTHDTAADGLHDARLSLGAAVLDDLFPEGAAFRRSLVTYTVLLALAALIATFGLYADSVAAIIGAMVVAPLGGAIMALAAALVTGRVRWQTITLLQVVLGALMVVGLAYGVSWLIPNPLSLNPSLEARTHPTILDLGVALAAGAAGAFVAVRRTGSDALPGVAIAVSLVPPLATVGICAQLGRTEDAIGALDLFLTNFAAIVVVACIVFVLAGAGVRPEQARERARMRDGFVVAVVALAIISVPLVRTAVVEIQTTAAGNLAAPLVADWIGDLDLEVTDWSIAGETMTIDLRGSDPPPPVAPLASSIAGALGRPVTVVVEFARVEQAQASAAP